MSGPPRLLAVVFAALLLPTGCGGADEPPLLPVRGKALFKGQPIPRAEIVLHPQFDGEPWMPTAIVREDGTFAVSTRQPGDGAIAGPYKITVAWHPHANDDGEGPNLLPARYSDPSTSGLAVDVGPDLPISFVLDLKE